MPDARPVDRGELRAEDVADVAEDIAVPLRQFEDADDGGEIEHESIARVLDAVEVVRHAPAPVAVVLPEDHLLVDLDQVERDEDLVEGDQFLAPLAIELPLGVLRREGVSLMRRSLAPVGPDGVGVEQANALEAEQRRVLRDERVPVPVPAAMADILAGGGGRALRRVPGRR